MSARFALRIADVDGDGVKDILACRNEGAAALRYFSPAAYGDSWRSQQIDVADTVCGAPWVDVDGDGATDIVVGRAPPFEMHGVARTDATEVEGVSIATACVGCGANSRVPRYLDEERAPAGPAEDDPSAVAGNRTGCASQEDGAPAEGAIEGACTARAVSDPSSARRTAPLVRTEGRRARCR